MSLFSLSRGLVLDTDDAEALVLDGEGGGAIDMDMDMAALVGCAWLSTRLVWRARRSLVRGS
jgi:hypothetical protein